VPPDPTVQAGPPEGGFARSSTEQQACWRAGRQRQAFAAGGTDPQGSTATRAVALEGALPVARRHRPCRNRRSKLPRCKAQAAQAWQPRGLPCSEAPCQAAECGDRMFGATMASQRRPSHRPPEAGNPKVALLGSTLPVAGRSDQRQGNEGEPPLPATPAVRAWRPRGPPRSEAPCRWLDAPVRRQDQRSKPLWLTARTGQV
jgi:hypothetical protein